MANEGTHTFMEESAAHRSYGEALLNCFRGGAFSAILDITLFVVGVSIQHVLHSAACTPVMSATDIPMLMVGFNSSVVALFVQLGRASTPRPPTSAPISSASVAAKIVGATSLDKEGAIESPVSFVSSIGTCCVTEPRPTESDPLTTLQRRYSIAFLLALVGLGLSTRWLLFASAAPGARLHFSLGTGDLVFSLMPVASR
ncbi:hypothetical protein DYB26_015798 [Aphanomyces astaci]|uniref:Uncharacterized protein n=1 Tax=Aphanomyces astaci TaxID=112090 RepID=A0A3R7CV50_APHAT|nr:hypothetical protein DYB26_015798 [Aphanomyces astaci]